MQARQRTILICAMTGALCCAPGARAADEIPFSKARLFFELNDTDGDLGIHGDVDGSVWKLLEIEDPRGRVIFRLAPYGRLRLQGLTQLFFESAEPPFDELASATFLARFPEGSYEISGVTMDGEELESDVVLSHVIPDRARNVVVNGEPAAESCDDELPVVEAPVEISWDPVTREHPTIGRRGAVEIIRYQVFAEQRNANPLKVSIDLPASETEYDVPEELLDNGPAVYKFEIQAMDIHGNQTAVESCFELR